MWSASQTLLSQEAAQRAAHGDPETLRRLGWGDRPADDVLARADGDKDLPPVALRWHPLRMLEAHDHLALLVDEFQTTFPKELTRAEYRELSSYEIDAWEIMRGAYVRESVRRVKAGN